MSTRNKTCECLAVKPNGDGTWQCIMGDCRRKFVPLDPPGELIEDLTALQLPVIDLDPADAA